MTNYKILQSVVFNIDGAKIRLSKGDIVKHSDINNVKWPRGEFTNEPATVTVSKTSKVDIAVTKEKVEDDKKKAKAKAEEEAKAEAEAKKKAEEEAQKKIEESLEDAKTFLDANEITWAKNWRAETIVAKAIENGFDPENPSASQTVDDADKQAE